MYDSQGLLHADLDTLTGGYNVANLDPVGFQGQSGGYTDIETIHTAAGLYTALSGPGGIYYDPLTAEGMARSQADALNTYDQLLHPLDGWTFGAYAHEAGQFGLGETKGAVNFVAGSAVALSPALQIANAQTGGRLSEPIATSGTQAAGSGFIQPVLVGGSFFIGGGEVVAAEGGAAKILGRVVRAGDNCFVAGTLVQMADGTTEPIEKVQVGEWVKSRNPQTGQVEAKRVDRVYVRVAPQVLTLTFRDGATHQAEAFTCTPEHPFLVGGKGFVKAEDLGIGTSLVTRAGPCLTLAAVARGAAPMGAGLSLADKAGVKSGGLLVYNLRVEDDHSYFVGTLHGGTCVHNADYEIFERFGSEAEATQAEELQTLTQRPGHPNGEKWISDIGEIKQPRNLGQDTTHRIEIKASPGTREWLRQFEIKKANEPNRYAIPADKLEEFNARVKSVSSRRFRLIGRQMRRR